jgi:hypothetical protein
LNRFAEAHSVCQDGAAGTGSESDAIQLIGQQRDF